VSNIVTNLSTWELLPGTAMRYYNPVTGATISRRQYMNLVASGEVTPVKGGSRFVDVSTRVFPLTCTTHTTAKAPSESISSFRAMAMSLNGGRIALKANRTVSIRIAGEVNGERIALQTRQWGNINDAIQDLGEMLKQYKFADIPQSAAYNSSLDFDFNVESGEVIMRDDGVC